MPQHKLENEIPSDLRSEVLDAVFRVSRSPMVLLDTEGRIIRFSDGCSEATGYSAAEVVGRPVWDLLIPPDEREEVMRIFRELSHDSLPNTHENDWLTRTGERIRLAWSNSPVLGPGGEVACILGTGINVSEQRRIEAALQESESLREAEKVRHEAEARLAAVVTISADAIISCDAEQRITFFNGGAETCFGWTAEEVKGRPLNILLPESLRAIHRQHVDDFATAPESSQRMGDQREIMGLRRTGETFPAEASISRTEVDGEPVYTVVLRDLTERRALEDALRDREFRQRVLADAGRDLSATLNFEQTLQSIADLAVRTIADFCVIDVLEAGEATRLVVAPQDPAQREIGEFLRRVALDRTRPHLVSSVHESERPILIEEVSKECLDELAQGEAYGQLLGALAPRSILAVPLIARSQLLGVILLISAEPGRRYGPSDLELAVELADRAALALDNARLYQKAQRAIALREDMISFVSHDLRNPLYSVGLMVDILARNAKADEAGVQAGPYYIREIRRVIAEMSQLIGDLLDVSLIEAGSLRLDRGHHTVQPLLEKALATMRPLANDKQILLELSVDPDVAPVHADADRTIQIVHNLVSNALKFTPRGGHVIVSAANVDDGVRFSVQDNGPGIESHTLDHLFDRYWQAGRTRTAGVGLGLAIVEGIVRAHGGSIEVESEEGQGTTFHFVLPRADAVPRDDRGGEPPRRHEDRAGEARGDFALAERVLDLRDDVARAATDEFLGAHPDWIKRYGERARRRGIEDAGFHVDFLGGALSAQSVESFRHYVLWAARVLSGHGIGAHFLIENLQGVRDQLGTRLDPEQAATVAHYVEAGVEALRTRTLVPSQPEASSPHSAARELYLEAALRGDRRAALTIIRQAVEDGGDAPDVYVDVLQEAQYEIGRRWESNQISVAREHTATAVCQYVLMRLYDELPRPTGSRGRAVVTGIRGEEHQIGGNMVADMLEMDGWNVRFLGTKLPLDGILEAVGEMQADLVGISTTMLSNLPAARELILALRDRFAGSPPQILVGGRAYHADPESWRVVGADGMGLDLRSGVEIARTLSLHAKAGA